MISKIYAYLGMDATSIDIPVSNRGSIRVSFSGGNTRTDNPDQYRAAITHAITDETIQAIIENSSFFKEKTVILYQAETEPAGEEAAAKEPTVYNDVVDFPGACKVLKANHGAKATQLKMPVDARKFAEANNIQFPNWDE